MKSKGFTLIELLVVVAIIGILATVVLVSLGTAQDKARNAARIQAARQIQIALGLYYDDNGYYPITGNNVPACFGDFGALDTCNVALTTSSSVLGHPNVQAMVQDYMGGTPQHYAVKSASSNHVQDTFYYVCRNAGCTKYYLTFVLKGHSLQCPKLNGGLNALGGTLATTETYTGNNVSGDYTYCAYAMEREVPANYNN